LRRSKRDHDFAGFAEFCDEPFRSGKKAVIDTNACAHHNIGMRPDYASRRPALRGYARSPRRLRCHCLVGAARSESNAAPCGSVAQNAQKRSQKKEAAPTEPRDQTIAIVPYRAANSVLLNVQPKPEQRAFRDLQLPAKHSKAVLG